MSPLAPSESVDAFLSWLAQPPNAGQPGHGHAHSHGHVHGINGLGFTPQKGKVSDKDQEYAARLRELARSPLEEMAKPLLVGTVVPTRTPSEGKMTGKDGKERKEKKKENRKNSSGHSHSSTTSDASKTRTGSQVKAQ